MSVALNQAIRDPIAEGRAALVAGDAVAAAQIFHGYAQAKPADYESRYWLYSALQAVGASEAASQALEQARVLHSVAAIRAAGADMVRFETDRAYCAEIGRHLYATKMMGPASLALGRGLDFEALDPQLMLSYGLSLQHQGRAEDAIHVFRALAELCPNAEVHQFLLTPHFYVADGIARHAAEARRWAALYAPPRPAPVFANPPAGGRKLRIGYVAPNFNQFQNRQFVQPLLENHDRAAFEVFIYPAQLETAYAEVTVSPIGGLDDAVAAELIRGHGIDVLIDVWGHTAGGRLGVFGHRAAPVQATWLNYQQTTGLTAMDYVLCADCSHGHGMEESFVEKIWRIGANSAPFRPDGEPSAAPAPALKNGYVTFASFNNPAKLTDETVAAWARILQGVASARLILKYGYFADPILRRVTGARFAAHGVDPARIDFRGHSTGEAYAAEFGDVDLALDPAPVPGGTTSLEALSRGVPVLTQDGPTFYARAALPIFITAGLEELVACDWDDYVARAIAIADDIPGLQALRDRARAGFATAGYRDEPAIARDLEKAYRGMFAAWEVAA
jgi:protein O-GlcNAc transferase